MTANNGWPGKPGVPRDPGLPGAHWLKGYTEDVWMYDGDGGWSGPGYSHKLDAETVAARYSYLGPVLTPAEVQNLRDDLASSERERAHQHGRADRNAAEYAREQAKREALQKRVAKLEGALITAQNMLSEMGISSAEKCQMAYDYLREANAALTGGEDE